MANITQMKLTTDKPSRKELQQFSLEAAELLVGKHFSEIAKRYGYAMAYGREIGAAIQEDFNTYKSVSALSNNGKLGVLRSLDITFYKKNDSNLVAAADCIVQVDDETQIGMNLVVTFDGASYYISLEDLWSA